MPQQILPIYIEGETNINEKVHYNYDEATDTVCYYLYCLPFYSHLKTDHNCFKMVIAQLSVLGHCKNHEIISKFGITKSYMDRAVKTYRKGGIGAFFEKRNTRSASVLTAEVITEAQQRLFLGESRSEVAESLGIKLNTLGKAINDGRLAEKKSLRQLHQLHKANEI
jgi:hypothetical protein